jgi:hypothetical protein
MIERFISAGDDTKHRDFLCNDSLKQPGKRDILDAVGSTLPAGAP